MKTVDKMATKKKTADCSPQKYLDTSYTGKMCGRRRQYSVLQSSTHRNDLLKGKHVTKTYMGHIEINRPLFLLAFFLSFGNDYVGVSTPFQFMWVMRDPSKMGLSFQLWEKNDKYIVSQIDVNGDIKNCVKLKVLYFLKKMNRTWQEERERMTEGWNLRHRCEAGNVFASTFMWFPLANHSCPTALKYALQYLSLSRVFL